MNDARLQAAPKRWGDGGLPGSISCGRLGLLPRKSGFIVFATRPRAGAGMIRWPSCDFCPGPRPVGSARIDTGSAGTRAARVCPRGARARARKGETRLPGGSTACLAGFSSSALIWRGAVRATRCPLRLGGGASAAALSFKARQPCASFRPGTTGGVRQCGVCCASGPAKAALLAIPHRLWRERQLPVRWFLRIGLSSFSPRRNRDFRQKLL